MSLVSRSLEENGIPTVVVGNARDIVEECGVSRFLFSDLPLGNPCGRPFDTAMQRGILEMALDLLEHARLPRTTVQTPYAWDAGDETWKEAYGRVDPARAEALRKAGEARRANQRKGRANQRKGKGRPRPSGSVHCGDRLSLSTSAQGERTEGRNTGRPATMDGWKGPLSARQAFVTAALRRFAAVGHAG